MQPAMHLFASAINLAVDFTAFAQFGLFAVFLILIKPLLFDPLLKVYEAREKATDGAKKEAQEMDAQAGELLQKYEAELAKVRREAGLERERLRADAARMEASIMAAARAETATILEEGKARIATEVAELRRELEAGKPELAARIAGRILDREVAR
jgi:F-type H+-transporting ATPase subunit b